MPRPAEPGRRRLVSAQLQPLRADGRRSAHDPEVGGTGTSALLTWAPRSSRSSKHVSPIATATAPRRLSTGNDHGGALVPRLMLMIDETATAMSIAIGRLKLSRLRT